MVGEVLAEALDDHVREEARAEDPLLDRALGPGGEPHVSLAAPAGVLLPRDLVDDGDLEPLELPDDFFADLGEGGATGAAALLLGQLVCGAHPREVIGELELLPSPPGLLRKLRVSKLERDRGFLLRGGALRCDGTGYAGGLGDTQVYAASPG